MKAFTFHLKVKKSHLNYCFRIFILSVVNPVRPQLVLMQAGPGSIDQGHGGARLYYGLTGDIPIVEQGLTSTPVQYA